MNLKFVFFACLAYLIFAIHVEGVRRFFNGRPHKGFVGSPGVEEKHKAKIHSKWMKQKVDNFNSSDRRTWYNRYYARDTYYQSGGPIFLMLRGEDSASSSFMVSGAWINYAETYGAMLFQLEHRFYGKSFPTNDLSVESLSYLTVNQALADTANFITKMTEKYNYNGNKWIIFGGSYAGALSVWLAEHYPHLVFGVVSSSGPINLEVNFVEYLSSISQSLANYSKDCSNEIDKGMLDVQNRMKTTKGQYSLYSLFMLCDSAVNATSMDVSNLLYSLTGDFMNVVQYSGDNSGNMFVTIDEVCGIMLNQSIGSSLERLAEVNKVVLNKNRDNCVDFKYDIVVSQMKNTSLKAGVAEGGDRQWVYQTCNELGFFQTTDSKYQIFGTEFSLEFFTKQCEDIFGQKFNHQNTKNNVKSNNQQFGGLRPNATNVICVQGTADPWHTVGLNQNLTDGVEALVIDGTAHCADMYAPSSSDLPQLTAARAKIVQFLGKILDNNHPKFQRSYYADSGSSYEESNSRSNEPFDSNADPFSDNNNEPSNESSNESSDS